MNKKRIYTIVGSFFLFAVLVYGVASISVSEEAQNTSAWAVRCDEDDAGKKTYCEMFSSISVKETGVRVAEFAAGYPENADGAARGVVTLPLGMMLAPGGALQVDENDAYSFTMRTCTAKGCHAFIDLNDKVLKQLTGGEVLTLTFVFGGKKLALGIPLNGFSDTFKTLK